MPKRNHALRPNAIGEPIETTLLELVQLLARAGRPEDEIVAAVLESLDREEIVLTGNFRGARLGRDV